jgi:hypothetical protein
MDICSCRPLLLVVSLLPPRMQEEKPVVFKGSSRAKNIFKLFDHDKDKFLSRAEFEAGLKNFINAPELSITPEQIEALWQETDINKDEKVSWIEFNSRFCGGPHPSTLLKKTEKKLSLHLQTPRKKDHLSGKNANAVAELKIVLESTYDGPKLRFKAVDLSKMKALNVGGLKKLLNQLLTEEKNEAKKMKRDLEEWAANILNSAAGVDAKNVDKLFAFFNEKKSDKIDLGPFFEQLKLRPPSGETATKTSTKGGKSKKKKMTTNSSGPQAYILTTVKAEHVRDFLSEQLLAAMPSNSAPNKPHTVKCHPPLKHWGDDERKRKALANEGYKVEIFLSERTRVKAVVKLAPPASDITADAAAGGGKVTPRAASAGASSTSGAAIPEAANDILIFAAYRTEYTAMARFESLYHARITMDEDENIKKIEMKEKKNWVYVQRGRGVEGGGSRTG